MFIIKYAARPHLKPKPLTLLDNLRGMFRLLTMAPGALIVAFGLYEVFQDLFHPTRTGSLSDHVSRALFVLFRRRKSLLPLAGPLALVLVIFCWVFLLAAGFALIYWSSLPDSFRLNTGTNPQQQSGFLSAIYFSLEALTTLGLGDLTPKPGWLRILATFEALVGFSLVTASVSWVLLIYPALARTVTFARRVSVLVHAEQNSGVDLISNEVGYLLGELMLEVIRARVDLVHFPIIYYFYSDDRRASLPDAIPHLVRFAEQGSRPERDAKVRLAATALRAALDEMAELLRARYVKIESDNPRAIFEAFAEDQRPRDVAR